MVACFTMSVILGLLRCRVCLSFRVSVSIESADSQGWGYAIFGIPARTKCRPRAKPLDLSVVVMAYVCMYVCMTSSGLTLTLTLTLTLIGQGEGHH